MIDRSETIELDESAVDVYTDKLADMGVPTPDVPYEAHVALNMLVGMARSRVDVTDASEGARIIAFPART